MNLGSFFLVRPTWAQSYPSEKSRLDAKSSQLSIFGNGGEWLSDEIPSPCLDFPSDGQRGRISE